MKAIPITRNHPATATPYVMPERRSGASQRLSPIAHRPWGNELAVKAGAHSGLVHILLVVAVVVLVLRVIQGRNPLRG